MITLKKEPFWWSAAHSPVVYEFDYQGFNTFSAGEYSNGKMFVTTYSFADLPTEGMYIYISGGTYKGLHLIKEYVVLGGIPFIVTDTDFTTTQTSSGETTVKLITEHIFELNAGYRSWETPFNEDLPAQLLAEFKPEVNSEGLLVFNISGYLKSLFTPDNYTREFEYGALTYLTGLFNAYRLTWSNTYSGGQSTRMVLNSALTQMELQSYTTGLQALSAQAVPVTFDCETYLTYINGAGAYLKTEFTPTKPDFDPTDFSTDFSTQPG